jgi:Ca2+-binding EF-hand superfamily protein
MAHWKPRWIALIHRALTRNGPESASNQPLEIAFVTRTLLILASTALFASAANAAQTPSANSKAAEPRTRAGLVQSLNTRFGSFDLNADGTLTADELEKAQEKRVAEMKAELDKDLQEAFAKLDADKNGQLSLTEYKAAAPDIGVDGAKLSQIVTQLDTNKDGKVTKEEFTGPTLAGFDMVDANKDGTVTPEERQKANAARGR